MRFDSYHPGINLFYFAAVLTGTVFFRHPVFLAISFCSAFFYSLKLRGARALRFNLFTVVLALVFAGFYASYHHFGLTTLRRNLIGNQFTLEALCCGAATGVTIAAVLMWFSCIHEIFSADKIVYLFGRISPRLSLFLAILLRLIPQLSTEAHRIQLAQSALGRGTRQGNLLHRLRNAIRIGSILITWCIEAMVLRSDSMRSRGSTLRGRTAFSIYRFDSRDRTLVFVLAFCLIVCGMAALLGQTSIIFDPSIRMLRRTALSYVFYAAYAVFCLLPPALELAGSMHFRMLQRRTADAAHT